MLGRLALAGLVLAGLPLFAIFAAPVLAPTCTELAQRDERYDVAIILGSYVSAEGRLGVGARSRVEAGIALFDAGVVPQLLMTGAGESAAFPSGRVMAQMAQGRGVPAEATHAENAARSTLQNALFSRAMVPPDARILLVTEGFHLTRGWASFTWAGLRPDRVCASDHLSAGDGRHTLRAVSREMLAWWANLARASGYSLAVALGGDADRLEPLLR